uniref:Uncharacterized protein n=1 Tax=Aegilops tauschii subsp. strangulata TaxID=200361 RepID=A0A453EQ33_AEGTS
MQGGTEAVRRVWRQLQDHDVPVSAFWLQVRSVRGGQGAGDPGEGRGRRAIHDAQHGVRRGHAGLHQPGGELLVQGHPARDGGRRRERLDGRLRGGPPAGRAAPLGGGPRGGAQPVPGAVGARQPGVRRRVEVGSRRGGRAGVLRAGGLQGELQVGDALLGGGPDGELAGQRRHQEQRRGPAQRRPLRHPAEPQRRRRVLHRRPPAPALPTERGAPHAMDGGERLHRRLPHPRGTSTTHTHTRTIG